MGCGASAKQKKVDAATRGVMANMQRRHSAEDKRNSGVRFTEDDDSLSGYVKSGVVIENSGTIGHFYTLSSDVLAQSRAGNVRKVTNKSSKQVCAMKSINKRGGESGDEAILTEINCLKIMDHPHVVKLFEVFEDVMMYYLVIELCSGGELFENIFENGRFTEREAANGMQHLLRGLCHIHRKNVAHRGICPENLLLKNSEPMDSPKQAIKINDFACAYRFQNSGETGKHIGPARPFYASPQQLDHACDESCDLWSAGVVMYVMLAGYPPFPGKRRIEVRNRVGQGHFEYHPKDVSHISEPAKLLLDRLLTHHQSARITAAEAVHHEWVKKHAEQARVQITKEGNQMRNIMSFCHQNRLKKVALTIIAHRIEDEEILDLKRTFLFLDEDQDGAVTFTELQDGLAKLDARLMSNELEVLMKELDVAGSDSIDYTEFVAATMNMKHYDQEGLCWAAFRAFDCNNDGIITRQELFDALGEILDEPEADQIMEEISPERGSINFDEFMAMMRTENFDPVTGAVHRRRQAVCGEEHDL